MTRAHEHPEAIEAFLAQRLDYLTSRGLGDDDQLQKHNLKLLREVCRAYRKGHIPASMTPQYRGILRNLRPKIIAAQKAGLKIPAIVAEEIERAISRRRR